MILKEASGRSLGVKELIPEKQEDSAYHFDEPSSSERGSPGARFRITIVPSSNDPPYGMLALSALSLCRRHKSSVGRKPAARAVSPSKPTLAASSRSMSKMSLILWRY